MKSQLSGLAYEGSLTMIKDLNVKNVLSELFLSTGGTSTVAAVCGRDGLFPRLKLSSSEDLR